MSTITGQAPIFALDSGARTPIILHQSNSWLTKWRPLAVFRRWAERRGQRRVLAELASVPHLLNDIGLTRAQAMREANKLFWQR